MALNSYQILSADKVFIGDLDSDHSYVGIPDNKLVGEAVNFGDLLYFDWATKRYKLAKANVAGTMPGSRVALESKNNGELCEMLVAGFIRDDSFEFTTSIVYVSTVTAGKMSSTIPSTAGDQVQRVGEAHTADIIFFNPGEDVGTI